MSLITSAFNFTYKGNKFIKDKKNNSKYKKPLQKKKKEKYINQKKQRNPQIQLY